MTGVSVLVPYRPDGGARDRAWTWVRDWWAREHPGWQVVEGRCDDGPWRKAVAVADALSRADGTILVVADADVVCDGVSEAVRAVVQAGARWAIPHLHVHRLTMRATDAVYEGVPADRSARLFGLDRRAYVGVRGGGMVVLKRRLYGRVPLDPRFAGWGEEDLAWGLALTAMTGGQPWRGTNPLWHLWHPPAERLNPYVGSAESHALHVRYQYAAKRRADMEALLAETQPARSTP